MLHVRFWLIACFCLALCSRAFCAEENKSSIRFNRDIRPILVENCFACHGPDPAKRKANLRLDTREGFFNSTPKRGPAVVPGNLEKSELWRRLTTADKDDLMPPPDSKKQLSETQKSVLKRWIQEGAPWQAHWSLIKPERPDIPQVDAQRPKNPIDAFLLAALEKKGLAFNAEADPRTLARRASLDLTGLPPRPELVERFLHDKSSRAYEKLVEELMKSPHYGEHRARYWLDAARYADTHGLHFDNARDMWPFRDWVIRAFNSNKPFDRFTVEQIAGDLLPDADDDTRTASGFERCNITTNEGGSIEEENLVNYARDRVETLSWVWLGLTANCAVCHDHKFDPITMKDFYSMSAFFRNTTQGGFDGNVRDSSPSLVLVGNMHRKRWEELKQEVKSKREGLQKIRDQAQGSFTNWLEATSPEALEAEVFAMRGLILRLPLNDGNTNAMQAIQGHKTNSIAFHGSAAVRKDGKFGPAPKFDGEAFAAVPGAGDFDRDNAFSTGGWFYLPGDYNERATLIGRMEDHDGLRGWELWHEQGQLSVHLVHHWPNDMLKVRSKDRINRRAGWQHVFFTYDGSGRPEGVKIYTDGKPADVEVDRIREFKGSIRNKAPLTIGQREKGSRLTSMAAQDIRIYKRALSPVEARGLAMTPAFREWKGKPGKDRKIETVQPLLEYYLGTRDRSWQTAFAQLQKVEKESESLRLSSPQTHVQEEKKNSIGVAHILFRGQYDKRKEQVTPAVFSALHALPEGSQTNRLALAKWIVSPENPLTARVTVNRLWQEIFGVGLVKTAEDFGIMGESPSHPELLDWLAVEFQESGWDVRHMIRLMVTSEAYKQSAAITPEKLEKDPANRLISRAPRFRMDAEMVRDYALAVSGLLNERIGGPSVKPYQPPGVWDAVAMPESNTRFYDIDYFDGLHRRGMYTFWKRAAPPPGMDVFNAPSRETSCLRRERTNTPLQALATLNDVPYVEAARHLAETALQSRRKEDEILDFISARVLSRSFRPEERTVIHKVLSEARTYYDSNPQAAREFLSVGASKTKLSSPAATAAWTLVANQVLNLDEALNK